MEGNIEIRDESFLDKLDKLDRLQDECIELENQYNEAQRILSEKKLELGNQEDEKEIGE